MRRKKTVMFCEAGFDILYGAQKSLLTYLSNMNKDIIDPIVIAPGKGKFTDEVESLGIKLNVIEQPESMNKKGNILSSGAILDRLKAIASSVNYIKKYLYYYKSNKPELVYCNDIRSILTSGLAARLRGIPVLWYVRIDKKLGFFNVLAANIANYVVTIADNIQNIFPKKLVINNQEKFITIYTGIDLVEIDSIQTTSSLRVELGVDEKTNLVALVGSIQPRKGQADFVDAISNLRDNDIEVYNNTKFLIVGDLLNSKYNDYLDSLKDKIASNKLENNIYFLGRRNDIFSIMKQIDITVLPSYSEGLPRTVLEAFSCSCPVIASDVAGTSEILTDHKNGILIEPGNTKQLANSIGALLNDKELRIKMGYEGRLVIEEKFTLKNYIDKLDSLIMKA